MRAIHVAPSNEARDLCLPDCLKCLRASSHIPRQPTTGEDTTSTWRHSHSSRRWTVNFIWRPSLRSHRVRTGLSAIIFSRPLAHHALDVTCKPLHRLTSPFVQGQNHPARCPNANAPPSRLQRLNPLVVRLCQRLPLTSAPLVHPPHRIFVARRLSSRAAQLRQRRSRLPNFLPLTNP